MNKLSPAEFAKQFSPLFPRVMRGFLRQQTDAFSKGKISPPQYLVLEVLYAQGPQNMSSLAQAIGATLPAASGLVARMVKQGLLQRQRRKGDRRVVRIGITVKGSTLVRAVRQQREKTSVAVFARLSAKDREDYLRILEKLERILFHEQIH